MKQIFMCSISSSDCLWLLIREGFGDVGEGLKCLGINLVYISVSFWQRVQPFMWRPSSVFLTGWSYFSMSFDGLTAKVDCDWMSFGIWRVQKETLSLMELEVLTMMYIWIMERLLLLLRLCLASWKLEHLKREQEFMYLYMCNSRSVDFTRTTSNTSAVLCSQGTTVNAGVGRV